jgi:zinc D-Ala-D-Ala carboxypeptidase
MISEHISLEEATKSATAIRNGIDNTPSVEAAKNMLLVAKHCFEPLRKWYGKPIRVNSFYRCPELNALVKGSPTSDHVKGMAIDIDAGSIEENQKLFDWLKDNVEFTQLINEYNFSWVHISYDKDNLKKQILVIK